MKKIWGVLLVAILMAGLVTDVSAQSTLELYQSTIRQYRTTDRSATIAREQYNELETLAALETLINSSREMFISRDQTLVIYSDLLYAEVAKTLSIDPSIREQHQVNISALRDKFKAHQEVSQKINDLDSLKVAATDFNTISPEFKSATYQALIIIDLGRTKAALDSLEVLEKGIMAEADPAAQRQLKVVTDRRVAALADLEDIASDATKENYSDEYQSRYQQTVDRLQELHGQLQKILKLLEEAAA